MAAAEPKNNTEQVAHKYFQVTWIAFQCVLPIAAIIITWIVDVKFDNYPNIPALFDSLKKHNEALIYDSSLLQTIYRTFVDGSLILYSALLFVSIHIELSILQHYKNVSESTQTLSIISLLFAIIAFMGYVFLKVDVVIARSKPEQDMLAWLITSILSVIAAYVLSWAAFWRFSPYSR